MRQHLDGESPKKRGGFGRKTSKSAARETRSVKKGGRLHKALNNFTVYNEQSRQSGKESHSVS